MKIVVVHEDGTQEALTLTEPLAIVRGERLHRLITSTGMEHWFTLDGYYDGFGRACSIPTDDPQDGLNFAFTIYANTCKAFALCFTALSNPPI